MKLDDEELHAAAARYTRLGFLVAAVTSVAVVLLICGLAALLGWALFNWLMELL